MIFHKRPINRKRNRILLSMDLGLWDRDKDKTMDRLQISNKDLRMSLTTKIEVGLR